MSDKFLSWEQAVQWLRQQPEQQKLVYDSYYDDPLITAVERYAQSDEWRAVQSFLPPEKKLNVLDVGAGRGIASYALAKQGFNVTALVPDPSHIVGAKAIKSLNDVEGINIHVVEEFSEKLPFDSGCFDLVFARAVLHHTNDLTKACQEFYRVLKPGGRLVAIREHVISKENDLPTFLNIHPLHKYYGGEHAYLLSEYLRAFNTSGFYKKEVLAPLESPINLAPHSVESFKAALSERISKKVPILKGVTSTLFSLPLSWFFLRKIMYFFDNRPGRLYSFILDKN